MSLFQPKQKIIHELSLIDVLIDANCLSNTTPLFLYIFAGLIEPVFLLYKKGGHPPWIPASTLYTLYPRPATPLLYTLQHPSSLQQVENEKYVYSRRA